MQKFRGTITSSTPATVPKIWEAHLETGKYTGRNGEQYGSKISMWVPVPRHGEHLPGIFIRLSNPSGSAYTRLTADELSDLFVFFRHNYQPAYQAVAKAQELSEIYSEAERALTIAAEKLSTIDKIINIQDN